MTNAIAVNSARSRVMDSFNQQNVMGLIGANLAMVEAGQVDIVLPYRADLCQQHGFLHAGISSMIADSAGGYAALSIFDQGENVLTTEFKMNFLEPAQGDRFMARGRVVKPGRRMTVCQVEVYAYQDGLRVLCVVGLMTVVRVKAMGVE